LSFEAIENQLEKAYRHSFLLILDMVKHATYFQMVSKHS